MQILTQDLCRFATYACGVPFACGLPLQKSVSMGHHSNSLGTILYLDQYTRIVYYHICYSDSQVIKVQINLDEWLLWSLGTEFSLWVHLDKATLCIWTMQQSQLLALYQVCCLLYIIVYTCHSYLKTCKFNSFESDSDLELLVHDFQSNYDVRFSFLQFLKLQALYDLLKRG